MSNNSENIRLRNGIVRVKGYQGNKHVSTGTGFFIGDDGSILTCFHVVGDLKTGKRFDKITITFNGGEEREVDFLFAPPDPQLLDIAILRLPDRKLPSGAVLIPLHRWNYTPGNDDFRAFGFRQPSPAGKGSYATGKIVGEIHRSPSNIPYLQLSSQAFGQQDIQEGMSGSPVVHQNTDQIAGVISLLYEDAKLNVPLAIPIERASEVWPPIKARLQEEQLLQELKPILEIDGNWFTAKGFKFFYKNSPFHNLTEYDKLHKKDKPAQLIAQLRGEGQVYDLINYLRGQRPAIPLTELVHLPPVHHINFVNRDEEIKEACDRFAPSYILYEAPAGYGKTSLLKAIEQKHFQDNWLCVYVQAPKDENLSALGLAQHISIQAGYPAPITAPETKIAGHILAAHLTTQITSLKAQGLVLLIDNVERLPEKEVDAFVNEFIPALQQTLQKNIRVRFAGRYTGSLWERETRDIRLKVVSLSPFRFRYVKETVRLLLPSLQDPNLYAAHLMHITGGHPGCMAKIIERTEGINQPIGNFFDVHQKAHKKIVLAVAKEVYEAIPKDLREIFDVLSVFRRYNYRILDQLKQTELISYSGNINSLAGALAATYLVDQKGRFFQDAIVRRLLTIRLRQEEPQRFLDLCKEAKKIYLHQLGNSPRDPEVMALEGLYQELQLGYYRTQTLSARQVLRKTFFDPQNGILHHYLKKLKNKLDSLDTLTIRASFLELIAADWEFCFAVNFYLRGESFNNELCEQVRTQIEEFFRGITNG